MHAKAKIISICPTHFLAEYFVESLQVFAGFHNTMERGSYIEIKLLEHAMKVVERIFE